MGTPRKINVILLNIKVNRPKLVNMCRYNWKNTGKIHGNTLNLSEDIAKCFRGYFFESHCILSAEYRSPNYIWPKLTHTAVARSLCES